MKLLVIRHSFTKINEQKRMQGRIDEPLSPNGITHAHEVMKHLSDINIDYIVSSPLIRALQTAMIAASYMDYHDPIIIHQKFVERDFGTLDYMLVEDAKAFYDHPESVDGFESHEALEDRINEGLNALYLIYHQDTLLMFCHAHVIKALLNVSTNASADYKHTVIDHQTLLSFSFDGKTLTYIDEKDISKK